MTNNDSPETITVKFECCCIIGIRTGNGGQDISHSPYQNCYSNCSYMDDLVATFSWNVWICIAIL